MKIICIGAAFVFPLACYALSLDLACNKKIEANSDLIELNVESGPPDEETLVRVRVKKKAEGLPLKAVFVQADPAFRFTAPLDTDDRGDYSETWIIGTIDDISGYSIVANYGSPCPAIAKKTIAATLAD